MKLNEYIESVVEDGVRELANCWEENDNHFRENAYDEESGFDRDYIGDILYDLSDYISGNCDGSYYCNRSAAIKELRDVIFDSQMWDILVDYEAIDNFITCLRKSDPEGCDVILRDVLVFYCSDDIVDGFIKALEGEED